MIKADGNLLFRATYMLYHQHIANDGDLPNTLSRNTFAALPKMFEATHLYIVLSFGKVNEYMENSSL